MHQVIKIKHWGNDAFEFVFGWHNDIEIVPCDIIAFLAISLVRFLFKVIGDMSGKVKDKSFLEKT